MDWSDGNHAEGDDDGDATGDGATDRAEKQKEEFDEKVDEISRRLQIQFQHFFHDCTKRLDHLLQTKIFVIILTWSSFLEQS